MFATITVEEAQTKLKELIDALAPGEEVVITENQQPVAKLVALPAQKLRPLPGLGKGMLTILAEDDEHLKDFAEYMPEPQQKPRQPGTLRGTVLYMAPDFDAPLEDFKEYME